MTMLELKNINKFYGTGPSRVQVLKDVNFNTKAGEMNLVMGPSGSGKSTFLTIAGGLQTPTSGEVKIEDQDIAHLTKKQRDKMRLDKIGFILQSYALVPYLTVKEQFKLVDRVKKTPNLAPDKFNELLKKLGIDDYLNQYPGELSGGQNQRVAIARALFTDPELILADEPTASLDSARVKQVAELLKDLAKNQDKGIVIVTHDLRLVDYADRIYDIVDGVMTERQPSTTANA